MDSSVYNWTVARDQDLFVALSCTGSGSPYQVCRQDFKFNICLFKTLSVTQPITVRSFPNLFNPSISNIIISCLAKQKCTNSVLYGKSK
jgi:hypothetical protein